MFLLDEDDIILRCPKCKRTQLERKWANDPKNAKKPQNKTCSQ